jgi:hypothetical protein
MINEEWEKQWDNLPSVKPDEIDKKSIIEGLYIDHIR